MQVLCFLIFFFFSFCFPFSPFSQHCYLFLTYTQSFLLSPSLDILSLKHLSRATTWLQVMEEKKKWVVALSLMKELLVYVQDQFSPWQSLCKNAYRAMEISFHTVQTYNVIPKVKCVFPAAVGSSSSSLICDSLQRLVYHSLQSQVYKHGVFFRKLAMAEARQTMLPGKCQTEAGDK